MTAQRQIADYEQAYHRPGAVAEAVAYWSAAVHGPRRRLDAEPCECCYPDGTDRDLLHDALHRLRPRARSELRVVVDRLDAVYLRRIIPDPTLAGGSRWWSTTRTY